MAEVNVFSTSSIAALTLVVAACVVACIFSCKLEVTPEIKIVAEDDGYLIGETDPLSSIVPVDATAHLAGEDIEEVGVPLDAPVVSAVDLIEDKADIDFIAEDVIGAAEVITDLNGNVEANMLTVDLGEAGGVIVIEDLSSKDPAVETGEVLEESEAASPFTEAASDTNEDLPGEDIKVVDI